MKRLFSSFFTKVCFLVPLVLLFYVGVAYADAVTLVSETGTGDYTVPDGWTSSGTVEGGSYLKLNNGTITSPSFDPHNGLSFAYSVATFGSGTNHPLTIRILNADTDEVIVEKTTATPTSSSYINTNSPLSLGDVNVAFKIQLYAPSGKGIRLRDFSVTGTPAGETPLADSDLAITGAPVVLNFDLYNNNSPRTVAYTTSSTGAVTVSGGTGYVTTSLNTGTKTVTVTPTAVTPSAQTITINQAADATYAAGSATFVVNVSDSTPFSGGDLTFVAGTDLGSSSASGSSDNVSKQVVTISSTNAAFATDQYRFYSGSTTTISTSKGTITSIVFTQAGNYPVSNFSTAIGSYSDGTWTGRASSVAFTASAQVRASQIVVTVDLQEAPSISANDVNIAYNVTSGSIIFSVSNEPEPAGTLSASVISGNWLSLGVVGATVPFTCAANPGYERQSTVRLTYSYGVDDAVTKDVVISQASNPEAVDNISDITATGTYKVKGTIVAISQRGFIVGDGTGYVYYYNNTDFNPAAYSIGDKVKLDGTVSVYGGVFEFTNTTTISSVAESNYSAEDPTVLSGSVMDTRVASTTPAQLSSYVQYEGTLSVVDTHYNITAIDGASTAIGSISYPINTDFTSLNGKIVRVKGYYVGISSSTYYNTMLESVEEVLVASVSVNPSTVNITSEGGDGTINVSYNNFTPASTEVHFLQADGTTPVVYDWITAEIDGENNVSYHIDPYHGASPRSAYFNVYSLDGEPNEYISSLVTIRQSAYVADFASLPFSFTEGRAAIAGKAGLSQTGLGSDYASAPLLKFDGKDDALVLSFNSDPGTLSFDIKGNGYSGGTFKVQTSVNGIDYTDLATYTELGNTENEEFTSIDSKVRYIRWIYSNKSEGNVALGNISLSKAPNPSTIVLDATRSNGRYWVSFFDSVSRYDLPDGAQAFTMNSSHELFLLGDDGKVIPKNTAVIIISNTSSITLTKGADTTVTINGGENILIGSDIPVETLGLSDIPFVLGIKKGKLGFYMYTGSDIPANKAYYLE